HRRASSPRASRRETELARPLRARRGVINGTTDAQTPSHRVPDLRGHPHDPDHRNRSRHGGGVMSSPTAMDLRHLRREACTALELAIVELAPSALIESLATAAG